MQLTRIDLRKECFASGSWWASEAWIDVISATMVRISLVRATSTEEAQEDWTRNYMSKYV
jgi:hypothetical protein